MGVNTTLFTILWLLFGYSLLAAEPEQDRSVPRVPSPLIGTWEAIITGQQLVHIELSDKKSFLVLVNLLGSDEHPSKPWIYALTDLSFENKKVGLRFSPPSRGGDVVTITGDQVVANLITGTIEMGRSQGGMKPHLEDIVLRKGTWTRNLSEASQQAENAIKEAQTKETIETGSISNISIDNQAILQNGDWIPSAKEAWNALQKVQLFLDKQARNDKQIQNILSNKLPYRVQFIGIKKNGRNVILCNFFPAGTLSNGEEFPEWKEKQIMVMDGGFSFWRIDYDPEKDECSGLEINGDA